MFGHFLEGLYWKFSKTFLFDFKIPPPPNMLVQNKIYDITIIISSNKKIELYYTQAQISTTEFKK